MNTHIFERFDILAQFLSKSFGKNSEIVIQSTLKENSGIVAIYNGHISGRKVGDSLTRLALQIIEEKLYLENEYLVNYEGKSKDPSRIIQSSTYFIKNEVNEMIGMLCVNTDVTEYRSIAADVLSLVSLDNLLVEEGQVNQPILYTEKISQTIPDIIKDIFLELNILEDEKLDKNQKIEIISELNKRGVFNMKGAISEVAKTLNISEPSAYRYLAASK
jgi:predicted transcriptional regulator YheO